MAYSSQTEAIEKLAAEIGENVYLDVAKWHLYLQDAHLHTAVAERVFPMLSEGTLQESKVMDALNNIPIKLGGGKREVPLTDLLPNQCQASLMEILEEYQRQL